MANVELYTTPVCPYCIAAKDLLKSKGVSFTEFNVMGDPAKRREMIERASGRTTVPQIFINSAHVGGCDDIYELDSEGKLDPLLAAATA
jgi:glutaredoxin 3